MAIFIPNNIIPHSHQNISLYLLIPSNIAVLHRSISGR